MLSFVVPEELEIASENLKKILTGEDIGTHEYTLFTKKGATYSSFVRISPIFSENRVTGVRGLVIDITERKKAEVELKIAASIFDLASDSIFVHDMDGNIVKFNEAAYKLRGYTKEEMAKMKIQDLDTPESAKLVKSRISELLRNGSAVFESVEVCKAKSLLPVELHVRLIELGGKKLILSVARCH